MRQSEQYAVTEIEGAPLARPGTKPGREQDPEYQEHVNRSGYQKGTSERSDTIQATGTRSSHHVGTVPNPDRVKPDLGPGRSCPKARQSRPRKRKTCTTRGRPRGLGITTPPASLSKELQVVERLSLIDGHGEGLASKKRPYPSSQL